MVSPSVSYSGKKSSYSFWICLIHSLRNECQGFGMWSHFGCWLTFTVICSVLQLHDYNFLLFCQFLALTSSFQQKCPLSITDLFNNRHFYLTIARKKCQKIVSSHVMPQLMTAILDSIMVTNQALLMFSFDTKWAKNCCTLVPPAVRSQT